MKPRMNFTRREFCAIAGSAAAAITLGGACRRTSFAGNDGRLTARPRDGIKPAAPGQTTLGLDRDRDAILHIPATSSQSLPLFIMLHGATQSADDMFWYLGSTPEEAHVAVLAPNSRDTTWDGIHGGFGPDVDFLNLALQRVFETAPIDPKRISIGGFSDGASYGLSLGLVNGDLFHSIVAFSPGFIARIEPHGKPRIFVSHGTHDHILPGTGRPVANMLKSHGYDVTFREFDGDHEIPADIAREGLRWVAE